MKVYDGDTCTCIVDLGFKLSAKIKVRMIGIDTPEIRTIDASEKVRGEAARDFLRNKILDKNVILHTQKKGKFGRWLGEIWEIPNEGESLGMSINQLLIQEGHAKAYDGGKR